LVEIAHAVEHQMIGMRRLDRQVLAHHRRGIGRDRLGGTVGHGTGLTRPLPTSPRPVIHAFNRVAVSSTSAISAGNPAAPSLTACCTRAAKSAGLIASRSTPATAPFSFRR